MARPCTVCVHAKRAEIDQRLAFQVVNVKQLAAEMGLGRDAVRSHRAKHLPAFLPAFQARADALTLDTLQAEAQRLYLVTLDALAQAERGVLVEIDDSGKAHYRVSSTAVARLIREARTSLGLLASLAVDGEAPVEVRANGALDERIAQALDRALAAVGSSNVVVDADVVEDEAVHLDDSAGEHASRALALDAAPRDLVRAAAPGPARSLLPLDADAPSGGSEVKGTHPEDGPTLASLRRGIAQAADGQLVDRGSFAEPAETWEDRKASIISQAAKRGVTISSAATREELKADGYDTVIVPPDPPRSAP